MALKNTIKVQRAIHNLTQADLAEKIGVSRQTINAIEANKYIPSTLLALRMAEVFNARVEDFFEIDDDNH